MDASETLALARNHHRQGRFREARALYEQVLAARPNDPDALHLLGVIALQAGQHQAALDLIERAIAQRPEFAEAHNSRGAALQALGRRREALNAFRRAGAVDPTFADAHFNLGTQLLVLARPEDAIAPLRQAIAADPGNAEAHFNLASALSALKRYADAEAAYREAIARRPGFAHAYAGLGAALNAQRRFDAAAEALGRALALDANFAEAHFNLGNTRLAANDLAGAIECFHRALALKPTFIEAHGNLAVALKYAGRVGEAIEVYRRAVEIDPRAVDLRCHLAGTLIEEGDAGQALPILEACLGLAAAHTMALAFKAIALAEIGDRKGARVLLDVERLVRPFDVATPPGYATLAHFNAALAEHVLRHPSLMESPANHATRQGQHSGEILVEPKGPVGALEAAIRRSVEEYIATAPPAPGHPFLTNLPERFLLSAWAVVMPAGGHQVPHIHPAAVISGVYYVKVPPAASASDASHAGWIEFGRPDPKFRCRAEPEVHVRQPREGRMFLFPSYLYHRTIPFASDGQRISIAFDVMPD